LLERLSRLRSTSATGVCTCTHRGVLMRGLDFHMQEECCSCTNRVLLLHKQLCMAPCLRASLICNSQARNHLCA
jgi:hypothetical protein